MLAYRKLVTLAAVGAAALAAAPASHAQGAVDTRPTVFVSYFTNGAIGANNADLQPLAKGVADMLITELSANPNIRVVERTQLEELFREQNLAAGDRVDPSTAIAMGKTLGAHHMITGVYVTDPRGRMRLDLRAVDVATTRVEYTTTVTKSKDEVIDMITQLAGNANRGMNLRPIVPEPRRTGDAGAPATGANVAARPSIPVTKDSGTAPTVVAQTPAAQAPTEQRPVAQVASATPAPRRVPFEAVLLYSKGLAEADRGNRQQAVELYRQSLARFPNYPAARRELGRLTNGGN
jgi:TolB-like protein